MKRPLFLAGCVYLAGTVAAFFMTEKLLTVLIFSLWAIGGVLAVGEKRQRIGALMALTLSISFMLFWMYQLRVTYPLQILEEKKVISEGEVLEAQVMNYGTKYTVDGKVGGIPTKFTLYTYNEPEAEMGDGIICEGKVSPAQYNMERSKGILVHVFAEGPVEVAPINNVIGRMRSFLLEKTAGLYYGPTRGMMQGILFGYKGQLSEEVRNNVSSSGISHLLSVSGLHVSIVSAFLTGLLIALGLNRRIANVCAIPLIIIFMALSGFSPSATRAGIMSILYCFSVALRKDADALTSLAFSALCMVMVNPYNLFHAGFLLSCSATLGILLYARPIEMLIMSFSLMGKFVPQEAKFRISAVKCVSVSMAVYPFSVPILLVYFQSIPILSALTYLMIFVVVGPVLLLGFASLLFACIPIPILGLLSKGIAMIVTWICKYILAVAKLVSSIPFATGYSREWYVLIWSVVCASLILWLYYNRKKRLHKDYKGLRERPMCIACILCCMLMLIIPNTISRIVKWNQLEITATESALVLTRSGRGVVVGDIDSDYEAEQISDILRCAGVNELDMLMCTSKNLDESAGIPLFLEEEVPEVCILPTSGVYLEHIKAAYKYPMYELRPMRVEALGGINFEVKERIAIMEKVRQDLWIYAGGKSICKTSQIYDIMNQYTGKSHAVFDGENVCSLIKKEAGIGVQQNIAGETVLKIRLD